ncbi:hypothetical protein MTR_1g052605 [Medicago truncatula]|uniref:Uncharacterized protein n=1 Tax=Medicago truncatula TaxID=3880 RepID=A0A072VJH9_MEDTR|nr:hypothetical protein MTR_1g052605 [Medicago truncatula]
MILHYYPIDVSAIPVQPMQVEDNLAQTEKQVEDHQNSSFWKGKDVSASVPQVYTDEEERATTINYLKNCSAAMEEPFIEVVSKKNKKRMGSCSNVIFRTHVEFNRRQANGVAHELARVAPSHASSHVYDDVPSCIRYLIANEKQ